MFTGIALLWLVSLSGVLFATPLDDYVNRPDPYFKYDLIKTYDQTVGYKVFVLNMTSQKWMDESFVKNPVWWHYVVISVPDKVLRTDAGFMFIQGGSQDGGIPTPDDKFVKLLGLFAASTGTIALNLYQIPNQPTVFVTDPSKMERYEDAVIAWTWKTFIENTKQPDVLLRLPMTKAAVRAMDAVTDFTSKQGFANLKKFMVAGESKRGWTTWTTAAVDKRVFAAIPIVMDMLDFNTNLHVHFRSLGGWTFEFWDYYQVNITTKVDTPELFEMAKIIDPKSYLDRYKETKLLIINTSGDEFFLPDNTHSYWQDLMTATDGSALLRRIPNAEHALIDHEMSLFFSFRSHFLTAYEKSPQPILKWSRPNNSSHGIITVTVDVVNGLKPGNVELYFANTLQTQRRDFRLQIAKEPGSPDGIWQPVIWEKSNNLVLKNDTTSLTYTAAFLKPISGWLGFFIQLSFPSLEKSEIVVTTETNIIPEKFPFDDCTLDSCFGILV